MKFTKEQLSEALKAKLSNGGKKNLAMSDRTFNEEVEDIYADLEERDNNDDLELDDVVSKKIKRLERIDNNVRNDNSKFAREWEKNHPVKNDKKDDKKDDGKDDDKDDDKLDILLKEIQKLKEEQEQEKTKNAISEKRNSLKSALKVKNVKNEEWIDDQLELIHIDSETDIEALTERLVNSYNKFSSNTSPSITPTNTSGKGDGKDPNLERIRKMREEQLKHEKEGI